jgi:calcineurin-like phosphoesterase family protein
MIASINDQESDYVWILGDIVYNNSEEEWDYILEKYKGIRAKRFHAGGNHDMNYHYERYYGIRDNQWEAESRFLNKIGYRYITIEDDLANYMMINMNDSLDRIESYLDIMLPQLNSEKPSILFTHHCAWDKTRSKAEDSHTWVKKSFNRDSLLSELTDFDYLIHGDWSEGYYSGVFPFQGKRFNAIGVGNLNEGDPLYITTIKITKDTLWSYPVFVEIPDTTTWKAKSP